MNSILKKHENKLELQEEIITNWNEAASVPSTHAIISVDSNHLYSNEPIEDTLASSKCIHTNGKNQIISQLKYLVFMS